MSHGLWNIATPGELFFAERLFPVRGSDGSPMLYRGGIIVFDFEVVTPWLLEVNRVSKVGFVGFGYTLYFILCFVIGKIFVRFWNLFGTSHTKAVVISVRLVGSIRAAFMHNQAPLRIGMFHNCLFVFASDNFQSQEVGKDRQRLIE